MRCAAPSRTPTIWCHAPVLMLFGATIEYATSLISDIEQVLREKNSFILC
jgi:hypothetical protein